MNRFFFIIAAVACFGLSPFAVSAARFDLKLMTVVVTPDLAVVSKPVKFYVTVDNVGESDVEGMVMFRDGDTILGGKPISVKAIGNPEEVWMSWTPKTSGNHVISIQVINDTEYPEASPVDNGTTKTIFVDQDTDGDGIPDSQDSDADNDGLSNTQEGTIGTNPLNVDTDGDGVNDKDDYYPLDPKRSKKEVPVPPKIVSGSGTTGSSGATVTKKAVATSLTSTTKTAPSPVPMVLGASTSVTEVAGSAALQDPQEYIVATSTAPAPVGEVLGVSVTVSSSTTDQLNGEDVRVPKKVTNEKELGGSDTLSIVLWFCAGLLGFLTLLAFLLARRKKQDSEERYS